jgi:hypothetical protein
MVGMSNALRHLFAPLALGLLLAAPAGAAPAGGPAVARAASAAACADEARERQLKEREVALLGGAHAEEHARVRRQRCRVLLGLEAEPPPAPPAGPAPAPALAGQWSEPFVIPVVGISAVLLNDGKVLFWSYDPAHYYDPDVSNLGVSYLWDPATRSGRPLKAPENIWCGGQTILADGRVFIAGGNLRFPDPDAPEGRRGYQGDASTYIYDPPSATFIRQMEMMRGRWYPTVTQLADNSAIITSGWDETGSEQVNPLVERFVPSADRGGVGRIGIISIKGLAGLYPFQYLLPSGAMLQAGPERDNSWQLDPVTWTWARLPDMQYDHIGNANGITYTDASVSPARQIVTIAGNRRGAPNNEWLDGYRPGAGWRDYPRWNRQRHNANTVILPDGALLTVGGNAGSDNYDGTLFSTELYSRPASDLSGSWTEVAPHSLAAAYHSSAILLPDATVLLSEDDRTKTVEAAEQHKVQVYSPPYLFRGPRPTLEAPAVLARGTPFQVRAGAAPGRTIASAVLIAPAAVTHGNDMHQRFVRLPVTVNGAGILATVPVSRALVPPGYYMLFVIDSEGVPSAAQFVHVG